MSERVARRRLGRRVSAARSLCALQILVLALAVGGEQPQSLEALMAALSQVRSVEADYTETVQSSLLATVLSTHGHLVYAAPDRILKTGQGGEQVEIVGDLVRVREGGSERELSIRDYAPLERLVVALQATFAGDLARLKKDYELDFAAADGGWTLDLRPRDRTLLAAIERIDIAGRGADIDRIAIEESGGDRRDLQLRIRSRRPVQAP